MEVPVQQISEEFKKIREAAVVDSDDGEMWDAASKIRSSAKDILRSLPPSEEAESAEVQEPPDSNAQWIFQWIRKDAAEMVMKRRQEWAVDRATAAA